MADGSVPSVARSSAAMFLTCPILPSVCPQCLWSVSVETFSVAMGAMQVGPGKFMDEM